MRNRRLVLLAAVLVAATAAGLAAATNFSTGPLVQVSGASPFAASCGPENVAAQEQNGGVLYRNSEVEPWIDVNPMNPNNIVGVWQQDRWSNGGAVACWPATVRRWQHLEQRRHSQDHRAHEGGGQRELLTARPIPGLASAPTASCTSLRCPSTTSPRPSTAFDSERRLVTLLASKSDRRRPDLVRSARSSSATSMPTSSTTSRRSPPTRRTRTLVYAVWDRLVFPASERASRDRRLRHASVPRPVWFARSTNGGARCEPARQIYDPGQNDQTIGNQIFVLPDGRS